MTPGIDWLRFVHILAALWLAAGLFAGAVVRAQTRRAPGLAEKVFGFRLAWRLTALFTLPGFLVAGLLGIYLVGVRGYTFSMLWVHLSTMIWGLLLVLLLAYLVPTARRAVKAADASLAAGAPTPRFERLAAAKLPGILSDVVALGVVVLTLLMVFRPI